MFLSHLKNISYTFLTLDINLRLVLQRFTGGAVTRTFSPRGSIKYF